MNEQNQFVKKPKPRKAPYVLAIVLAWAFYGLSVLDPTLHGPRLWAIFICCSFASWIAALKLRELLHGKGWVFPETYTALCVALGLESLLYVMFSK